MKIIYQVFSNCLNSKKRIFLELQKECMGEISFYQTKSPKISRIWFTKCYLTKKYKINTLKADGCLKL